MVCCAWIRVAEQVKATKKSILRKHKPVSEGMAELVISNINQKGTSKPAFRTPL
jgi:hypothetical protein